MLTILSEIMLCNKGRENSSVINLAERGGHRSWTSVRSRDSVTLSAEKIRHEPKFMARRDLADHRCDSEFSTLAPKPARFVTTGLRKPMWMTRSSINRKNRCGCHRSVVLPEDAKVPTADGTDTRRLDAISCQAMRAEAILWPKASTMIAMPHEPAP